MDGGQQFLDQADRDRSGADDQQPVAAAGFVLLDHLSSFRVIGGSCPATRTDTGMALKSGIPEIGAVRASTTRLMARAPAKPHSTDRLRLGVFF